MAFVLKESSYFIINMSFWRANNIVSRTLKYYDYFVNEINCKYIWRCESKNIINMYRKNCEPSHLEIGPGTGAITDNILCKTKNYIGIEKDRKLSEKLLKKYKSEVKILNQDVLDSDFSKLFDKNIRIVGNIPYNISTQIITKCIIERENIISANFSFSVIQSSIYK